MSGFPRSSSGARGSASGGGGAEGLVDPMRQLTVGKRIEQETKEAFARAGITIPDDKDLRTAQKKEPCPLGRDTELVHLTTNMWGLLQTKITIHKYDIRFRGVDSRNRMAEFYKENPDNVVFLDLKDKSRSVFNALMLKHGDFFGGPVFCDLQSILYTTTELNLSEQGPKGRPQKTFSDIFLRDIQPAGLFQENFDHLEIVIRAVREHYELELDNVAAMLRESPRDVDRSLLQFLEIATSQHINLHPEEHVPMRGGVSYLMNPGAFGFTPQDLLVDPRTGENQLDEKNHVYLTVGVHKSVRFVSGPRDRGSCVLVIEAKKSPFHAPGLLLEKVFAESAGDREQDIVRNLTILANLNRKYKGKYVVTVQREHYRRPDRLLKLKRFVTDTAYTHEFSFQNHPTTVFDYYQTKHALTLQHPDLPLVVCTERGRDVHYPIELLALADNQRLGMGEADPELVRHMIKACAIEPSKLFNQNAATLQSLRLDNTDLQQIGVTATRTPAEVNGIVHAPPKLLYGANNLVSVQSGKWRTANATYYKIGATNNWAAIYVRGGRRSDSFGMPDLQNFVKKFADAASRKGMSFSQPHLDAIDNNEIRFKEKMAELSAHQIEYVLFVNSETESSNVHDMMKWAETHYGFVTQDNKIDTARAVIGGKAQTLENIINKANIKLGGLNYVLNPADKQAQTVLENILFIGFGANHPGGGPGMEAESDSGSGSGSGSSGNENAQGPGNGAPKPRRNGPPTVVGFAANCNPHPFEFVGDFRYQEAQRDEKVTVIRDIVALCLRQYVRNRNNKFPRRVILFRNGCAEGQFAGILQYEVPLIEAAIVQVAAENHLEPIPLTVLVPNKMHNVRLFLKNIPPGKAPDQNIKPGTTVDHTITHHKLCEFYLSAHTALQGTAKVPRYTVLHDQSDIPSEVLQRMVYWLCHGHQIVALTTSLPAPVTVANEYAKRGRNIYKSVTTVGDSTAHGTAASDRYRRMNFAQLSEALSYWHSKGDLKMSYRTNA